MWVLYRKETMKMAEIIDRHYVRYHFVTLGDLSGPPRRSPSIQPFQPPIMGVFPKGLEISRGNLVSIDIDTPLGPVGLFYRHPFLVGVNFLVTQRTKSIGGYQKPFNWCLPEAVVKALWQKTTPEGGSPAPMLQVLIHGTDFQVKVWKVLLEIPWGHTVTYQWIAEKMGSPTAARAVGHAVGRNHFAWLVPCHRVVPKGNGKGLGAYRWGPDLKKKLLQFEKESVGPKFC
jgi:O-6-methylguanine DNA methyltransferase